MNLWINLAFERLPGFVAVQGSLVCQEISQLKKAAYFDLRHKRTARPCCCFCLYIKSLHSWQWILIGLTYSCSWWLFLIERFPLISLIGICSYFLQPIRISFWTRAWPFFDNVTQPIQFSIDFRQLLAARKRKRWSGDVTFKKDLAGSD